MFRTPPHSMVVTRSTARKMEEQLKNDEQKNQDHLEPLPIDDARDQQELPPTDDSRTKHDEPKRVKSKAKSGTKSSSSMQAQRKKLELEAAQAKARLQMELIDKKLAADLAELEEQYSPRSEISVSSTVERWLEQELEPQPVPSFGITKDGLQPPTSWDAGTDGTVRLLASALKDLAATSTTQEQNANLLSRICTPRELPIFSGDPMEWLQFKQAYDESTKVCNFSPQENLWRLRKCLRGQARDAVTALLITVTSPEVIMSTLELQFGNPDIILSRIMMELRKMQPLCQEYHKDVIPFSIKVKNYVAAVRALGREQYLYGVEVASVLLSKLPTILLSKWADYSYPFITEGSKAKLDILSEFLNQEAVKVSTCSASLVNFRVDIYKRKPYDSNTTRPQTVLVQNELSDKCRFCRVSKHKLTDCKKFKRSLRKDRWQYVKRYGLCFKCLLSHHDRETCSAPVCDVNDCGKTHHRLLHFVPSSDTRRDDSAVAVAQVVEIETETVTNINVNSCTVLLKVVPINIHGPNGVISTTALLDDGSTVSLMSSEIATRAGLQGRRERLHVRGAWNNTELECDVRLVDFTLSNKDGVMFSICARSVHELSLPKQNLTIVNCENYSHLRDIRRHLCSGQLKPQVLIGQDNHHLLLPLKTVCGDVNEPCATLTPLGWCLHGRVCAPLSERVYHSALFITDDVTALDHDRALRDLHEEVRRSFSIEAMGVSAKPRQNAEDLHAYNMLEQSTSLVDGRWYVGLPWKDENSMMPDSFPIAMSRLRGVEKKMQHNKEYAKRYKERVNHLFENDFAEELTNLECTPKTWYLPHFGVDNPNKKKLRLVFDAAAKTNGQSLNDYLLKGPDLLMSLFGIMLRFRENKIAVAGDIKDMFLRVKIRKQDRNALRFLFRNNQNDPVNTYVMTSLIFGANCSPFIAQYVKNKNALRFESSMPSAVKAICTQHYMDDYIDSLIDEESAKRMVKDITYIYDQGGFLICNWASNSHAVLDSVPNETLGTAAVRFKIDEQCDGERTLGLIWHPMDDTLSFDVSFKKIPENLINGVQRPTKREMLRIIMSIFDVYGFLSPFTINGKILLQNTWRLKMNWDDVIPDEVYKKWLEWINMLKRIREIRLPRHYQATPSTSKFERVVPMNSPSHSSRPVSTHSVDNSITMMYQDLQLHLFCDASTKAMCAVAYWRWINNDCVHVAFIASKCRVAPVKAISVPRLELQAAVLASRLADTIIKEHRIKTDRRFFWCDSTTVLHWIYNDARNYKTFVAHRLGEIDELTRMTEWRYVPTKQNVADCATREDYDYSNLRKEWFNGPVFLQSDEGEWPKNLLKFEKPITDVECLLTVQSETHDLPIPEPTRFSSWLRLLRTTAAIVKFIRKCRKLTHDIEGTAMEQAECLLLKYAQTQSFNEDITTIKKNKYLQKSSKLLMLSPYLDEHGVLRVGGRIDAAAEVSSETKRPIILDGKNYITTLLVEYYHIKAAHGNQEMIVNELKQKYWIIRLRPTVKKVASKCLVCRINKSKPEIPRMGDLPAARMAHHQRPFTFCGVDLFGPMEVTVGRHKEKRYGVLFTCLTVRAIHLEIVPSLTTDSMIMAIRRMAARRGWPQHLYSDNGTNLRGADVELRRSIQELNEVDLENEAINHGTRWTFIPAASPHWGGAWERLVRSVKTTLKIILKERAPKDEILSTLLAEVENIVNSRPLTHVSVEPGDNEALTPNHFLLGTSSNLPCIGLFNDSDFYLRKQWRSAQRLTDMFWKRWVKEILPDMLPRRKWTTEQRPLQLGDLVLVVDPDGARNYWPRGRILEVCPGKDGRVRMVKVKTQSGVLTRSSTRVVRLPVGDVCC